MKAVFYPSRAQGCINAPPSKSMAHRALICGALSPKSVIRNITWSEDIRATYNCLVNLGAEAYVEGNNVIIGGLSPEKIKNGTTIDCNESGSTLRFLIPICLVSGKEIHVKGSTRLMERPLGVYESLCMEQGLVFKSEQGGLCICGPISRGNYKVRGDVSSQFISGLLFALTLLSGESTLEVTGKFESESYVKLTEAMLEKFGAEIKREGNAFFVKGAQHYKSVDYTVEGDCSNAAFLEAFNLIGGSVTVNGISEDTLQGDKVYKDIFKGITEGKGEFDLSDCPDLAPIAFAAAAINNGALFKGTSRLKIKESDRAAAMKAELMKTGIELRVEDNCVEVLPGIIHKPTSSILSHNDHRIVMAMSVICSCVGGEIEGIEAVRKSYPNFFENIKSLGVNVKMLD
ncbi:MAG: 3-phosphoshikimate 1-carboxyvinyltransferase [Clostridiales bacterium]|nr:3-phosphoshikimate 1-carboxyvinyltransferase [Clostridiales bacterium]